MLPSSVTETSSSSLYGHVPLLLVTQPPEEASLMVEPLADTKDVSESEVACAVALTMFTNVRVTLATPKVPTEEEKGSLKRKRISSNEENKPKMKVAKQITQKNVHDYDFLTICKEWEKIVKQMEKACKEMQKNELPISDLEVYAAKLSQVKNRIKKDDLCFDCTSVKTQLVRISKLCHIIHPHPVTETILKAEESLLVEIGKLCKSIMKKYSAGYSNQAKKIRKAIFKEYIPTLYYNHAVLISEKSVLSIKAEKKCEPESYPEREKQWQNVFTFLGDDIQRFETALNLCEKSENEELVFESQMALGRCYKALAEEYCSSLKIIRSAKHLNLLTTALSHNRMAEKYFDQNESKIIRVAAQRKKIENRIEAISQSSLRKSKSATSLSDTDTYDANQDNDEIVKA